MKKLLLFIFVWCQFCLATSLLSQTNSASISNLTKHVYVLASDSIQGRGTGTPGQQKAANYIAAHFNNIGIAKLPNNTYFQKFLLNKQHTNGFKLLVNGDALLSPWHFFSVSGYNHTDTIKGNLVFAGFASEKEIKNIDTSVTSLAFIANNPQQAYKTIQRIYNAYKVRNFFVIFPQSNIKVEKEWDISYQLTKCSLPEKYIKKEQKSCKEPWAKPIDSVTICYCLTDVMHDVFNFSDTQLMNLASNSYSADSLKLSQVVSPNVELFMNFNDSLEFIEVENVGGIIYGKDTNQTIVVSAHYDHLGSSNGDIFYGADDNASGSASLLELARMCALDSKTKIPERNILFIAFTAEELGLLGSEFYVKNPIFNLDSTVLNINMDMIGRCDLKHINHRNYVYLLNVGKGKNQYFKLASLKIEKAKGFKVSKNPGMYVKQIFISGSDHYSFYKKNIPVSVLFTGLHDDYHTPKDTPDKINYRNLTQITSLAFNYIQVIANNPKKYPVRF